MTVGTWLVAGTPVDQPYPCQCEKIDADPPQWKVERAHRSGETEVYVCDPYVSKKGKDAGQWVNRCSCWGDDPAGKPEGCCAHSEHSPRLRVILDGLVVGQPTIPPDRPAGWHAPHERAERDVEDVHPAATYADALGIPYEPEPEPYPRRWSAAEVTCACPTPWDGMLTKDGQVDARKVGYHCVGCHHNFRSLSAAGPHQRGLVCREPGSIRDPERGTRVYRATTDGRFTIWG